MNSMILVSIRGSWYMAKIRNCRWSHWLARDPANFNNRPPSPRQSEVLFLLLSLTADSNMATKADADGGIESRLANGYSATGTSRFFKWLKTNLDWIPQNWTKSKIKVTIRCAAVGWVSAVLFVIPPVEASLGQVGELLPSFTSLTFG